MASTIPDEPPASDSDSDPETIALRIKRKRSRRVSFADTEVTSVHVFRRDDDDESSENTAPDSEPHSSSSDKGASVIGFFKDVGGESDDFDDDENDHGRLSFLRPIGSPSPMSSAISFAGSASSNNEDEFFGPVSSNFIRPGLCDSAASDDFHEMTMDTTAFSLHYRSIARSESGGDMKTPTSFHLGFEEKTPTHDPSNSGSLMSLAEPKSLVPVNMVRGGEDSNDMSIVEGNLLKYDYGGISPTLDAILAEGSKDLHNGSVSASISTTPLKVEEVVVLENNGIVHVDQTDERGTEMSDFSTQGVTTYPESASHLNLSEANGSTAFDLSSNRSDHPSAGGCDDDQIQTPNQSLEVSNKLTEDKFQKGMESLELLDVNSHLLENGNSKATKSLQLDVYPLHDPASQHLNPGMGKENSPSDRRYHSNINPHSDKESVPMLSATGQQSIMNTPITTRCSEAVTPSSKHEVWYPSIQKSISRLRIKNPSPRASSLKDEIQKLKHRLSSYSSPNAPFSTVMANISKDLQCDFNKSPFVEKQVGDPKKSGLKSLLNTGTNDIENPVEFQKLGKYENSTVTEKYEASMHDMLTDTLSKDTFDRPVEEVALQLQSENNFQAGLDTQCNSAPVKSTKGPSQSPSKENQTPSHLLRNITSSPLRNGPSPHKSEIARSVSKTKLCASPSGKEGIGNPIEKELNHGLFMKELTPSPFRLSSTEQCNNMPLLKYREFPELILNNHCNDYYYQGLQISQSPLTTQDAESSFGRKRRNPGIILEDGNCTVKVPGSQRRSKVQRSENHDTRLIMGHSTVLQSDREKHGNDLGDSTWESWIDILVKFSGDSEQLLSPSTSNLSIKTIGVLEDMLIHQVKVKKYEMLCAQNQSQVNNISSGHKRVAEARLLLCRLAYEKAKLQLMQLKRQKLQSKVQCLSSAVQVYQTLKFNFTQWQSEADRKEIRVDERQCLVGEQEAPGDNVSALRHELKASDRQLKSLSNFFHSHIKLKGEPSHGATISLVLDHLKTRTFCRLIRHELQSWDVDGFAIKNGQFNILLSHQGYISQRFRGNVGRTSHIVISKELNNVKIMKAFPNISSLVAFGFVLESEATKEIFDSRCLLQETQVIRLQLCNLLDVVEEVQLARIEIANLIQTSFYTTSDDRLDLQLCFLDYKSSRKVTLSLDMTCLRRGIYPSEILPYLIQASESVAIIKAAAEDLEYGPTRIMRLCRRVSRLVQSS